MSTATAVAAPALPVLDPVRSLTVLATGPLSTVQDLGRPGLAALGVSPSGAADRAALRLANRLVGNPPGCAALEVTFGGLWLRADGPTTIAVTGAPTPVTTTRNGRTRQQGYLSAAVLAAGDEVRLGPPAVGLRSYLAVRGGVAVAPVLGSRSTDLLGGLGPAVLEPGSVLPVGDDAIAPVGAVDIAPVAAPPAGTVTLCAIPGPRHDWFSEAALREFFSATWAVGSDSNRVGIRLSGPTLLRTPAREGVELASEGVVRGSVQVPPAGQPVVFLADHPVTGGYPVIAVLLDHDTDRAAQARPGQPVRFWPAPRR